MFDKPTHVFGCMNGLDKRGIQLSVSGIQTIISGHLEIPFRNMLNEQRNEIKNGNSLFNERIIFMLIVVERDILSGIGINPFQRNRRAS